MKQIEKTADSIILVKRKSELIASKLKKDINFTPEVKKKLESNFFDDHELLAVRLQCENSLTVIDIREYSCNIFQDKAWGV